MNNNSKKHIIELENVHVSLKSNVETVNILKGINLKILNKVKVILRIKKIVSQIPNKGFGLKILSF